LTNDVNKAILIGRVGKDPEVRYMQSGDAVASFSLATGKSWKGRNGEKQEETCWHNLVAFKRLAEIIQQYVHKGDQLYVEGEIRNRSYEDKQGVTKYVSEIIVSQMKMLGSPSGAQQSGGQRRENPARAQHNEQKRDGYQRQPAPVQEDFDDDIPF
jgi:single-strand DNA-binding protein